MTRYFTIAEAEELLPAIADALLRARRLRDEWQEAEAHLERQKRRIAQAGGSSVNLNRVHAFWDQRKISLERLKEMVESITGLGVQLKDLDLGLIDFPTRYEGRDVLLCWKLGEAAILAWHDLESGYAGRQPIDEHFRAHHRGDTLA